VNVRRPHVLVAEEVADLVRDVARDLAGIAVDGGVE
jgi:hypothetical protein